MRTRREYVDSDDPELIDKFKAHCVSGWSPRTFSSRLKGGYREYNRLMKTSPMFAIIAKFFMPMRGRSVYTYLNEKWRQND